MILRMIFLVFLFKISSGQELEEKLFRALSIEIIAELNVIDEVSNRLDGFDIAVDPVTNSKKLIIRDDLNEYELFVLNEYGKDWVLRILESKTLPLNPLSDTLHILDTLNVFSKKMNYHDEKYCVVLENNYKYDKRQLLLISEVGFYGNEIRITFYFENTNWLVSYYFEVKNSDVTYKRMNYSPTNSRLFHRY